MREATIAEILEQYGPSLRRVAESYELDAALREDLFQEICLAIWKALPGFRGEASLKTFVFRIAHNRGLSHGWRESRLPARLEEPEAVRAAEPSPEDRAVAGAEHRRLLTAIHRLPLITRQVLTLRLEGLAYAEIGEIVGLSENAVTVRASRGRDQLRRLLDPRSRP